MSFFDGYTKVVFSAAEGIMGDTLSWVPSDGSSAISDTVLFNNPDVGQTLGDVDKFDFQTFKYWFEYVEGQFPGLKESVDSGNLETVTVKGFTLDIQQVVTKYDGRNYCAYCVIHD
jgi:hypothetical protein